MQSGHFEVSSLLSPQRSEALKPLSIPPLSSCTLVLPLTDGHVGMGTHGPFWDLPLFGVILNNLTLEFIGFAQCLPATSALSAVEYFRYRDELIPSHHICATLLFFIFVDGLPLSLQVVSVGIEKNHQRHPSVRDVRPGQ